MKKFAFVALFAALATTAVAANVKRVETPAKIIALCETTQGKKLRVSLDEDRKQFMVNYSDDLENPDRLWVKDTNEMFWNREYNAVNKVDDKELYANFDKQWLTFSVTDLGYDVLVTLKVDEGNSENIEILDGCKSIDRLSLGDEEVKDMTWVSNSEEE